MKYVSLFSGIEAASVAWRPLGWEPVALSEIEPFPCAVLAERFPDVPNLGDIIKIDWSDYAGKVDLVVGGSPCQAFSVAGRRKGLMDARGQLMLEYVRAVRDLRPRWIVWENVPGVLSQDGGRAFGTLLGELENCGYSLAWRVLDAQFAGVAQRRRRVFLAGHLGSECYPAAVLFERESMRWDSASSKEKREALARSAGRSPRGGGRAGASWAVDGNVCDRDAKQNGCGISDNVSPTLNTVDRHAVAYGDSDCLNPWAPQHDRVFTPDSVYQTLYAHDSGGADCGVVLDSFGFAQNTRDEVRIVGDGTVSGALAAEPGMKQTTYVCQPSLETLSFDTAQMTSKANRSNPQWDDPCHTLSAAGDHPSAVIAFNGNASGSRGFGESVDLSPTLRAGSSCGNQAPAIAFSAGQSEMAGSVGAQEEVAPTLRAGSSGTNQVPTVCVSTFDPRVTCSEDVSVTVKSNGHAPSVMTQCVGDVSDAMCMASTQANAEIEHEMCPTMVARQHKDPPVLFAMGVAYEVAWRWPWIVRRLMPVECERLQGFPDGWTDLGGTPDTPRYKALGNSMAVPVMRWIGERIAMVDALAEKGLMSNEG